MASLATVRSTLFGMFTPYHLPGIILSLSCTSISRNCSTNYTTLFFPRKTLLLAFYSRLFTRKLRPDFLKTSHVLIHNAMRQHLPVLHPASPGRASVGYLVDRSDPVGTYSEPTAVLRGIYGPPRSTQLSCVLTSTGW